MYIYIYIIYLYIYIYIYIYIYSNMFNIYSSVCMCYDKKQKTQIDKYLYSVNI